MADNEQIQDRETHPVKKRRFYKPRTKIKPEAIKTLPARKEQAHEEPKAEATKEHTAKSQPAPKTRHITKAQSTEKAQRKMQATANTRTAAKVHTVAQAEAPARTKPEVKAQPGVKQQRKNAPVAENTSNRQVKVQAQGKPQVKKEHKSLAPKPVFKKTTSFRRVAAQGVRTGNLADINFKYLDRPQFKDIHALVMKAQSYFNSDKETCCAKFRLANEAIITRLIKDLRLEAVVEKKGIQSNFFEQINLLQKEIPTEMVDSNVFAEMHNIRMIGNSFVHGDHKYSTAQGSRTCLIAMEKLARWLVNFEPKYLSYQRAKDLTKSNPLQDIWNGLKSLFKL